MAVVSTPIGSILVAQYQVGVSGSGAPISRQRSLSGIKTTATDQDIHDVATALFDLLDYPLLGVRRDDRSELVNEE